MIEIYGSDKSLVVETENFVVHIRDEKGELIVKANRKIDDTERLPLAYLLGLNYMIFKAREKK